MYRNRIKRLLDIFLSACGILCLSWLLLLLAVAIKLDLLDVEHLRIIDDRAHVAVLVRCLSLRLNI